MLNVSNLDQQIFALKYQNFTELFRNRTDFYF